MTSGQKKKIGRDEVGRSACNKQLKGYYAATDSKDHFWENAN